MAAAADSRYRVEQCFGQTDCRHNHCCARLCVQVWERHPTNYYAWAYARRLINALDRISDTVEAPFPFDWVVSAFSDRLTAWCFKHPSDTSGWSYLLFLLSKLDPVDERDDIVEKVIRMLRR